MTNFARVRIGLFGIGLSTYWEQFPDLKVRLTGFLDVVEQKLRGPYRDILNLGLVDSPERSLAAGHEARQQDIDLLVLYVTTYALSSTVLPLVRRANVPVLVLNLQPKASIDYAHFNALTDRKSMTGEWLAYCSACPVPEIANVFSRSGIPFRQITGVLHDDPECWQHIEEWMQAAQVVHHLSHTRLGLMGHYYSGMLDIATNLPLICSIFGVHVEILEVDELTQLREGVTCEQVTIQREFFAASMDILAECGSRALDGAAQTAVALAKFVENNHLNALAYYYKGTGVKSNEDTMSTIILGASALTSRGIPIAGEYEVKNVLAMLVMSCFGAGGSFTEYYAVDFDADIILMGHDGPGHAGIADGRPRVRPLEVYHGKVGQGLSIEMSVKQGPVTLLSIAESSKTGFKLVVAEGQVEAGPILEIGNTNSRYRFPCGARNFINLWNEQAPAHHCAVGLGNISGKLRKVAELLNIEYVQIG